jgi:hypothetical protein
MKILSATFIALVLAGATWVGSKQYQKHRRHVDCVERQAAFDRLMESIKQEAHEQIKIGTRKTAVSEFFTKHKMTFVITGLRQAEQYTPLVDVHRLAAEQTG